MGSVDKKQLAFEQGEPQRTFQLNAQAGLGVECAKETPRRLIWQAMKFCLISTMYLKKPFNAVKGPN